jgi:hypothetical protein
MPTKLKCVVILIFLALKFEMDKHCVYSFMFIGH